MKKLLLFALLICTAFIGHTQSWDGDSDGDGDNTTWDDPLNWDNDVVPAAGDIVEFGLGGTYTITGMATNNPSRVLITSNNMVTLDLDLTIGDGVAIEHAVKVQSNATLNFGLSGGASRTFIVNAPINRDGIQNNATGETTIMIADNSTLSIIQAQEGIAYTAGDHHIINNGTFNISGTDTDGIRIDAAGEFTNNGTLTITGANQDAIDNSGIFNNSAGTINIEDANSNGIYNRAGATFNNGAIINVTNPGATTSDGILSESTFNNSASGTITVTKTDEDCIELTGGTFTNDGTINVTAKDAASANNNGIAVGTASAAATLINTSNNSINANGGIGTTGRAIFVYDMGTLTNTGTMTFSGGNSGSRLYSKGATTNDLGGTIDLTDGRVNANTGGVFTNNGLMKSTRTGSGVFTSGTSVNNGFFDWSDGTNSFSSGSGTVTDNGISLNDASETTIDAASSCFVDVAEVAYTWDGAISYTASSTGLITFPEDNSLPMNSTTLTNATFPEISITITNICDAAVLPIELTYFRAIPKEDKVLIKWQTAVELNNDYMVVERSTDGRTFSEVGRVRGQGSSTFLNDYELVDNNPATGVNYYRLHQFDFDGANEYSDIVQVTFRGEGKAGTLQVYPTLISNTNVLNIDLTENNNTISTFDIFDFNGKLVSSVDLQGGDVASFSVDQLQNGMYFIKERNSENNSSTRFVIAR